MEKLNNFRREIKTALQLLTKGRTKTNYQQSDTLRHKNFAYNSCHDLKPTEITHMTAGQLISFTIFYFHP